MIRIDAHLDLANISRFRRLARVSRTMAAKALTFTAEKAVPAWRAGHTLFHRRNSWIDRGVRLRAARASTLEAQVGTLDRYMGRHVVGIDEEKRGRLFIPLYRKIGEAQKHNRARTRIKRMESTQRKPFRIRINGADWLARRDTKKRTPLTLLGKIQQGAQIDAKFDARRIVMRVVNLEFPRVYERLLRKWAETGRA